MPALQLRLLSPAGWATEVTGTGSDLPGSLWSQASAGPPLFSLPSPSPHVPSYMSPPTVPSLLLPLALGHAAWSPSLMAEGSAGGHFPSPCPWSPSQSHSVWEGGRASLSLLPILSQAERWEGCCLPRRASSLEAQSQGRRHRQADTESVLSESTFSGVSLDSHTLFPGAHGLSGYLAHGQGDVPRVGMMRSLEHRSLDKGRSASQSRLLAFRWGPGLAPSPAICFAQLLGYSLTVWTNRQAF